MIPVAFDTEQNTDVVAFLRRENPSAHSDIDEELGYAVSGLPLQSFSPDRAQYAFVAWCLDNHTIVALAFGMNAIAFRLPESRISDAVRDGARIASEIGSGWVCFNPWKMKASVPDRRRVLASWCATAARVPAAHQTNEANAH